MSNQDTATASNTGRRITLVIIGLFILFCIVGPNIEWIKSPFTPNVKVKIVDAKSGKPIKDIRVIVSHNIRYVFFPGSGHVNYSNSEYLQTNDNGEFVINRTIKPISFTLLGILDRDYDGTQLLTLNNDYEYMTVVAMKDKDITLSMKLISTKKCMLENMEVYSLYENHNYPHEIKSLLNSYKNEASLKLKNY